MKLPKIKGSALTRCINPSDRYSLASEGKSRQWPEEHAFVCLLLGDKMHMELVFSGSPKFDPRPPRLRPSGCTDHGTGHHGINGSQDVWSLETFLKGLILGGFLIRNFEEYSVTRCYICSRILSILGGKSSRPAILLSKHHETCWKKTTRDLTGR